jgi:DNA-directed RNA polymerase specialized sigma24 family protein
MESQQCPAFARFFDETCDHAFAVAMALTSDPTHAFAVARDAYLDLWRRRDHLPVTRDTLDVLLLRQAPDEEGGCGFGL